MVYYNNTLRARVEAELGRGLDDVGVRGGAPFGRVGEPHVGLEHHAVALFHEFLDAAESINGFLDKLRRFAFCHGDYRFVLFLGQNID
jgi:hypothetical protein